MNPPRLRLFLSFLFSLSLLQGLFAGDSVVFPAFNTGTMTGGVTVFNQPLNVTGMAATEYVAVSVTGNFVAGAAPGDAFSSTIELELFSGTNVYLANGKATYGSLPNSTATTLRWTAVLPRSYIGGTALNVRIKDPYDDAAGTYTSSLSNVVVTLYPASTPKHTFATFSTGTLTGAGTAFTRTLDTSTLPAGEYVWVNVTGDYVANAAPNNAYSGTLQMELGNGVSTVYWPASTATGGSFQNSTSTTLRWTGLLPKTYASGALSIRIFDPFTDASGPYRSNLNNVSVSLYGTPTPKKTFTTFNSGTVTGGGATVRTALSTTGMSGEYIMMSVTGNFTPGGNPAYSNTMRMAVTNGSSTVYWPESVANLGTLGNASATTLTWYGMLPISYVAGGPLSVDFRDSYTDGSGPYTSSMNNVVVNFYPVASLPTTVTSLNRVNATPNNASTVNWTLTFATAVTGVTASNFSLSPTVTGASIGTPTTANSGLTWNIPVTTGTGEGPLQLNLANATGFSRTITTTLPSSGQSYSIDKTAPTITPGAPSVPATRGGPVTYTVTYADTNFSASTLAGGNITLNKTGTANGIVAVSPGATNTRTVTISSITGDGTLGISIAAGTAADTAGNSAPASSASTTFTVDNTAPAITSGTTAGGTYQSVFGGYTIAASGAPVSYGATGLPTGLSLAGAVISGTPTQTGPFSVTLSATDAVGNIGSATLTLTIAKATATVTLGGLAQTYNGSARTVTATTAPAGLTVGFTYNGSSTAPTNAGSYPIIGTISDTNYQGTASGTLIVSKAAATVTLGGLAQTYNGSARTVTATTAPAGLTVGFTYNGSSTAPTNAGSYPIVGTISDSNYQGAGSGNLEVAKVVLTVTPTAASRAYGSPDPSFTFDLGGFVGTDTSAVVTGTPVISTTADASSIPAVYPLTATLGTLAATNYSFTFAASTFTVTEQELDDWGKLHFTEQELEDESISGPLADADGDDIPNLLEMAFGTDPRSNVSGPTPLGYNGTLAGNGTLGTPGQPVTLMEPAGNGVDFRAVFIRRNPALNDGLVYTPQFSADISGWQNSGATPVVLATSGDLQIVSVPYPLFVGGKKARFFRIDVTLAP